jgi:hypothetical protein
VKRKVFSILFALVLVLSFSLVTVVPATANGTPVIDGVISSGEWDGYYLGTSVTTWQGGMSVDVYGFADDTYLYAAYVADMTQLGWSVAAGLCTSDNLYYKTPESASWPDPGYTLLAAGGYPDDVSQTDGADWQNKGSFSTNGIDIYSGDGCYNTAPNPNVAEVKIPLSLLTYAGADNQIALSGQYWQYDWATPFLVALPDTTPPIVSNVLADPNPAAVGSQVTLTATIDDTATGGSNIASAEYSLDGGAWTAMDAQDGAFDEVSEDVTVTFTTPETAGVYDLCVLGTDEHDNTGDSECIMLVVYDPEGGFVTGGGWIDSPPGAYMPGPMDISGDTATMEHGGYTGYMARYLSKVCDPNSSPVTFAGTVNVTGLQDNGAVFIGLVDKKWVDEGNTGWMGGAYTYFGRRGDNLIVGPTDGNLYGEIVQTFVTLTDYFDLLVYPEGPPLVTFETTIHAGSIEVSLSGSNWTDDYGLVKDLNSDNAYPWAEFQYGAYVGVDSWPATNSILFDVTVSGCQCELAGKASFGFVAKYKKGASVPEGNTEFVFKTADLNFHSSSYDWLVVTGSDYAKFKGTGTINGAGDYKFMLWAGDGTGTDGADTFRIKIWEEDGSGSETVVYDNGMDQAIGGGQIAVHKK